MKTKNRLRRLTAMSKKLGVLPLLAVAALFMSCASTQLRQDASTVAAVGSPETLQEKIERGRALTIEEVTQLSQDGVPDEVLLRNFKSSRVSYQLSVEDVEKLKKQGVNKPVINAMLTSRQTYRRSGYSYGYRRYGYHGYYRPRYHHRSHHHGHHGHHGHHY